jgi:hypothetical protein
MSGKIHLRRVQVFAVCRVIFSPAGSCAAKERKRVSGLKNGLKSNYFMDAGRVASATFFFFLQRSCISF